MLSGKDIKTTIAECKNFRDLLDKCTFDTMVMLDLDNTVIEAQEDVGSDQWFVKLLESAVKNIPDKAKAFHAVITLYHAVQKEIDLKTVEENIAFIIKALQDIGILVLAITARGIPLMHRTHNQLNKLKIDFSRTHAELKYLESTFTTTPTVLHDDQIALSTTQPQAVYYRGIIFCNGTEKGPCAAEFFKLIKNFYQPKRIVMADDKQNHLLSVQKILPKPTQQFIGLRYSYLDEKVKTVCMNSAAHQILRLKNKFTAEEKQALALLTPPAGVFPLQRSPGLFNLPTLTPLPKDNQAVQSLDLKL